MVMAQSRDFVAMEKRRLEGAKLLKKGITVSEVAQKLGVTRQTVKVWEKRLAGGGTQALKSSHPLVLERHRN